MTDPGQQHAQYDVTGGLSVTPLIEEHRRLNARLGEFGGWQMPLWYAGASEEHAAVRAAAGLFDIGHMGITEITGPESQDFLGAVTTADVPSIEVGRCRYTFLLDPDGLPIDDDIIYRLSRSRFLLVVNAANAQKVHRWLDATVSGQKPLDPDDASSARQFDATLRDLAAPSAGGDRLAGIALQGPESAAALAELTETPELPEALARFELSRTTLLGAPAILSRTGYTGEPVGYEIFLPARNAPDLWRAILDLGEGRGVLPAGLAARDSLRIEAGLPLYGHELAGPHEITPPAAGYERFVDFGKDFFVGRDALLAREQGRLRQIVRFRLNRAAARAIRAGDPVGSRRGTMVGWVTSCALAVDVQFGMAWIEHSAADEDTELLVYPARHLERSAELTDIAALEPGDRLPMHESATVLPRFRR